MRRALELAERGRGLTSPNPMVGAVVVTADGEVVGEGFHARAGAPHAEVEALRAAGLARARRHALRDARAVRPPGPDAAVRPGARRSRRGARRRGRRRSRTRSSRDAASPRSRRAGVEVVTGSRPRTPSVRTARSSPRCASAGRTSRSKAGMTLDGKIADLHGASRWITGESARRRAHRLRSETDAIVVGVGTVLRDDPELTVRLGQSLAARAAAGRARHRRSDTASRLACSAPGTPSAAR